MMKMEQRKLYLGPCKYQVKSFKTKLFCVQRISGYSGTCK